MSLKACMTALVDVAKPSAIPPENLAYWLPDYAVTSFPYLVLHPAAASTEETMTMAGVASQRMETHYIALLFMQLPQVAGGRQAAMEQISGWVDSVKAAIHANPQLLDGNGTPRCTLAGQVHGSTRGMVSHIDITGSSSADLTGGAPTVIGWVIVPVQDLWTP